MTLKAILSTGVVFFGTCVPQLARAEQPPALKDVFSKDFLVGVALSTRQIAGDDPKAMEFAAAQFNSISPENVLKWQEVHPEPDKFVFEPADKYVEWGEKHGMFIVGHVLVWHNQTPRWVFEGDRDAVLARMRDHIHKVVGRYKGRIKGWDVVNEAIEDNGNLRKSKWLEIVGPDFIEKAFQFAHEADPDAELYYNDYNEYEPGKRRTIGEMVRNLKAKGIRIDAIGCQGHYGMNYPSEKQLNDMFADYAKLGVKTMITELDINVLPQPGPGQRGADITANYEMRKELDPYRESLPDDMQKKLAAQYAKFFRVFLKHRNNLERVTFWGVHDGHSWHNNWPVRGRTAHSLLFDRNYEPKPAFWAVVNTKPPSISPAKK